MSNRTVEVTVEVKEARRAKRRLETGHECRPSEGREEPIEEPTLALMIPEAQHAAWYQILRAHGKVGQRIEQRLLQAQQIPTHWYDVLVTLEKAPEQRLRMSELAENVLTSPSNLTRLVDRLETKGLLRRETCAEDRRVSYAVLTEAGAQARLAAWPIVAAGIVELFATKVNDEEAHVIANVLCRVADGA
jgi:DNA-binding MarR family transcriptional regulator